MPSISSLSSNLPANKRAFQNSGIKAKISPIAKAQIPGSMKIFTLKQNNELKPQDQLQLLNTPNRNKIRTLDTSTLPSSTQAINSFKKNNTETVPLEKLSTEYHTNALNIILKQNKKIETTVLTDSLQRMAHAIRNKQKSPQIPVQKPDDMQLHGFETQKTSPAPANDHKTHTKMQQRLEETIKQLKTTNSSKRLEKANQVLQQGLSLIQISVKENKPLSIQEKRQAATALAIMEAVRLLSSESPRTNISIQTWSLSLEDQLNENNPIKIIDLIDHALKIRPDANSKAHAELSEYLTLLQLTNAPTDLLAEPISKDGMLILETINDMPPLEIRQWVETMRMLSDAMRTQSGSQAPKTNVQQNLLDQALSEKIITLILKAESLAKKELAPTPGLPRGFEEGVLSLLQDFQEILRQLDKDLSAIFQTELNRILEQKIRDAQFIDQTLDLSNYTTEARQKSDGIKEQFRFRLEHIQLVFQSALPKQ